VRRLALAAAAVAVLTGGVAQAHVGASFAVAKFKNPPPAVITHAEPLDTVEPYTVTVADQSLEIMWDDGDTDPTGRFTFYYLDHEPTYDVTVDDLTTGGLATKIDDTINLAGGYYASCTCSMDMGVTCPVVVRDPNGNCANQFVWNTSALPKGTYWLIAVNDDPPFHVYNAADVPVVVAHGGEAPPPAVVVVRPDGFGAWDKGYRLQWLAFGKAPLTFDLSYGIEDTGKALQIAGDIAVPATVTQNADGSYGYDWDLTALQSNTGYFARIKVTDADGVSTFTDSHFAVQVFHNGGMNPPDMAMAVAPPKHGCDVEPGASSRGGLASMLLVFAGLALALYVLRRRAR
jgi:hypothetical protein